MLGCVFTYTAQHFESESHNEYEIIQSTKPNFAKLCFQVLLIEKQELPIALLSFRKTRRLLQLSFNIIWSAQMHTTLHLHLDSNSTGLHCANQIPKIERNHRHYRPLEAEWNLNGCV